MAWDICIHGDGIVGSTLALLLAQQRLRVGLVGTNRASVRDVRAYAINIASRRTLQSAGVWPQGDDPAFTPVRAMQVWGDDTADLRFEAPAMQQEALAWIVDVPVLEQALREAIAKQDLIVRSTQPETAALHVICEGKTSAMREQLGVAFDVWAYPQHALATRLQCSLPHAGVARQWFSQGDILAFLPMQTNEVAVVWSTTPEQAERFAQAEPQALAYQLERISQNALGTLTPTNPVSPAAVWPLQRAMARTWHGHNAQGAWALAGDAAHTVHPLAGQGLNLGLADVADLAQALMERPFWRGVDDAPMLRRYQRSGKARAQTMLRCTDSLQWLYAQPDAPWTQLRRSGLNLVNQTSTLKHWLAKQAMHL